MLNKLRDKIRDIFHIIPQEIRIHASHSLHVAQVLKQVLQSPFVGWATKLIPTNIDDAAVPILLNAITKVTPYLMIVDSCKDETDMEKMVECWLKQIRYQDKVVQDALIFKFASLLTAYLATGKIEDMSKFDYIVQTLYTGSKNDTQD